jgi:hypothetical protein
LAASPGRFIALLATSLTVTAALSPAPRRSPSAEAQAGRAQEWTFANLISGFCLEFLADTADARHLLPDDAVALRASTPGVRMHPALARVVKDQPEYASWTPAEVCVYRFGAANIAGTEIVARQGEGETIGWVAVAGRIAVKQPEGSLVATQLFTGGTKAQKASEAGRPDLRKLKLSFGKAPKSNEERVILEFGKTRLMWDGHAATDSMAVAGPVVEHWARAVRGGVVIGRWEQHSVQQRSMVGAVIVEGKDRFAQALRKSPIRYVGPLYQGGNARLSFE